MYVLDGEEPLRSALKGNIMINNSFYYEHRLYFVTLYPIYNTDFIIFFLQQKGVEHC